MASTSTPQMNFWTFLDKQLGRLPGWPSERQLVMYVNVALIWIMFRMARENGTLWNVELFKVILQALALTGFLNMVMAFFYSANKADETKDVLDAQRTDNTRVALDNAGKAIEALANNSGDGNTSEAVSDAADAVVDGAKTAAAEVKDGNKP